MYNWTLYLNRSPMAEKTRFNMMLPEGQKSRWERYVETNPDVTSLSQLVRQAVEAEINRDTPINAESGSEVASERLSELLENTQTIKTQVENIEDRLYTIEEQVQENPEISELAADVFEILPSRDEIENYYRGRPPVQNEVGAGTIEEFADRLGEDKYRIEKAVEKLQNEIALVYTTDKFGDRTCYYKEE